MDSVIKVMCSWNQRKITIYYLSGLQVTERFNTHFEMLMSLNKLEQIKKVG